MAYFSQAMKKELAPKVKSVLKKYGLSGTMSVRDHSSFVLNIRSGPIDFIGNLIKVQNERPWSTEPYGTHIQDHIQVNHHSIDRDYDGIARDCLLELYAAMSKGNWDNSDIMTDYFDVGWYVKINIGKWDKPYILTK